MSINNNVSIPCIYKCVPIHIPISYMMFTQINLNVNIVIKNNCYIRLKRKKKHEWNRKYHEKIEVQGLFYSNLKLNESILYRYCKSILLLPKQCHSNDFGGLGTNN